MFIGYLKTGARRGGGGGGGGGGSSEPPERPIDPPLFMTGDERDGLSSK